MTHEVKQILKQFFCLAVLFIRQVNFINLVHRKPFLPPTNHKKYLSWSVRTMPFWVTVEAFRFFWNTINYVFASPKLLALTRFSVLRKWISLVPSYSGTGLLSLEEDELFSFKMLRSTCNKCFPFLDPLNDDSYHFRGLPWYIKSVHSNFL